MNGTLLPLLWILLAQSLPDQESPVSSTADEAEGMRSDVEAATSSGRSFAGARIYWFSGRTVLIALMGYSRWRKLMKPGGRLAKRLSASPVKSRAATCMPTPGNTMRELPGRARRQ